MNDQHTKRIIVTGKVQGVFYRQSTVEKANQLHITGIVKNTANGKSVEVIATGIEESLTALIDWCRTGPPHANVKDTIIEDLPLEFFDRFMIQR